MRHFILLFVLLTAACNQKTEAPVAPVADVVQDVELPADVTVDVASDVTAG